jgi:hypothetical protein
MYWAGGAVTLSGRHGGVSPGSIPELAEPLVEMPLEATPVELPVAAPELDAPALPPLDIAAPLTEAPVPPLAAPVVPPPTCPLAPVACPVDPELGVAPEAPAPDAAPVPAEVPAPEPPADPELFPTSPPLGSVVVLAPGEEQAEAPNIETNDAHASARKDITGGLLRQVNGQKASINSSRSSDPIA